MGVIATALRHLIAAGVTGDALVAAIEDIESAMSAHSDDQVFDLQAERRRKYDRERAERKRESLRMSAESAESADSSPDGFNGFPHPSLTSLTPIKENPPKGGQKKVSQRGTRLHSEWVLPDDWGEWAEAQGMTPEKILLEEEKFKDFWKAKAGPNATKMDWEATWKNWVRRHLEEYGK